jgi:hypothetical protein
MAAVGWRRVLDQSELTGKVGESLRIVEKWIIRTDSPATTKLAILGAAPVGWYSAHWEFTDCKALEFSLSPADRTGMIWGLTVTFYIPPKDKKLDANGKPEDFWEAQGGTSTVPAFTDVDGETIVNAAGDPLEGLEREREEESWTLTKYYDDDTWKDDRDTYAGSVNSDSWADGGPKTWKCYFKGARKKELQNVDANATADSGAEGQAGQGGGQLEKKIVVETTWEFRKEPETWKCMPWDVGFMELVGGERKTITGADGKAVKQPVALNSDGTKKSPGDRPSVINDGDGVELYPVTAFGAKFGDPFIVQAQQGA